MDWQFIRLKYYKNDWNGKINLLKLYILNL